MSMPMRKFEPEKPMEQRVARLEASAEHVRADITEIKVDLRGLSAKIDGVKDGLAALAVRMEQGFANLNERMDRKLAWVVGILGTLILTLAAGSATGFLWLASKLNEL